MNEIEFDRIGSKDMLGITTRDPGWNSGHMKIFRVYRNVIDFMDRNGWKYNMLVTRYNPSYRALRLEFRLSSHEDREAFVAKDGKHLITICAGQARKLFGLSPKATRFVLYANGY
jgi:hypothetical protein